jgi:hypothetical protein
MRVIKRDIKELSPVGEIKFSEESNRSSTGNPPMKAMGVPYDPSMDAYS